MFAFGSWAGTRVFCTKKVHVKMIWKQFLYNFMVLRNGPVQNALFCLMDRYRNVCVWFMAKNCRSQRFELTVANMGTTGYDCKELPVPRGWNSRFPTWEPKVAIASNCRFPEVGTQSSSVLPVFSWWLSTFFKKTLFSKNLADSGWGSRGMIWGQE